MTLRGLLSLTLALLFSWPGDAKVADEPTLPIAGDRTISFETDEATWLSLDVSPDGQHLVLEILGDLYLAPITGGTAQPLTDGMAFDSQPAFSPDGARVVFVSDRSGSENLWTIDVDGGETRQLTKARGRTEFASPAWSPDGQHVIASRTDWGLRTFELWGYHVDGGKGVQITKAKKSSSTSIGQRTNSLGAVYSPDGRYLYYARKTGGFAYNTTFPQWQIARLDLHADQEDTITRAQGSAFRPALSPDGNLLVYGTRHEQHTGLRVRNLATGEDRWLTYPVQRDEQESRFTRDLLPGYAFTPDGRAVIFTRAGRIQRVEVADGSVSEIPFSAAVNQAMGPRLSFPYRLGLGPVKARLIRDPVISADGRWLAFSAFTRVYRFGLDDGEVRPLTPAGLQAFHPSFSPDGRQLAYVSWSPQGGHIWRISVTGNGRPRQLTRLAAYYTNPVWSPDGSRIVAQRSSNYERLYRENDIGLPVGADLIWLSGSKASQDVRVIMPSRSHQAPHFGPDAERIYLYQGSGGLVSVRYDGSDRREHVTAEGPGNYSDEDDVAADDIRLSPSGRHVLIHHANQLHVAALLNPYLHGLEIALDNSSLPIARLTDIGADAVGWSKRGEEIYWTVGHELYRRPLASVTFAVDEDAKDADDDEDGPQDSNATQSAADEDQAAGAEPAESADTAAGAPDEGVEEPIAEAHEAVMSTHVAVYLPRYEPQGVVALTGATIVPMEGESAAAAGLIEDGVVVIVNDRIATVGRREATSIPPHADVIDMSGYFIVPGYIDVHSHFPVMRGVLDRDNWAFMANLAYGVTTGLDVQPSTTDMLAYQDLIDAGLMTGPRVLSTGPGVFSNNTFRSAAHTSAVLRRYKEHYRVNNLKAYIAGNRKQRQWIVQAAARWKLMPTTEGALDMKLNLTHALDGFSGNEHNFPVVDLHDDVVQLVAQSGMSYTPALLVNYGGPFAENYFYTRESPHRDAKLRRFVPGNAIASRTLRRRWFHDDEYVFPQFATEAAKILRAGGRVGVGSHGQLQGLGYHWELRALASGGLTPYETLLMATRQGAEIIGVAQDIGTVSAGKLADLVVLRESPLADVRHSSAIAYVIKNGEVFHGDTLDKIWPESEPLAPQWWWDEGPTHHGPPRP